MQIDNGGEERLKNQIDKLNEKDAASKVPVELNRYFRYVQNMKKSPIVLYHSKLVSFGSGLKRECPFCISGLLLMRRHPVTSRLLPEDNCMSCGQPVIYADIEDLEPTFAVSAIPCSICGKLINKATAAYQLHMESEIHGIKTTSELFFCDTAECCNKYREIKKSQETTNES